jgi:probable rRNA maturation factor
MPIELQLTRVSGKGWLEAELRHVLRMLKVHKGVWAIRFVRDAEMKRLHAETMAIPTTTDVLTFDLRDNTRGTREGAAVELDTVICVDEARRRAEELGHPLRKELLLYAVHSLLHVQGYDDVTPRKSVAMHKREDELLVALGVGAVYGTTGAAAKQAKKPRARRKTTTR